jgi:Bacterial membrane protein YfhO
MFQKLQKYAPHFYAIIGFVVIALIYFYPVISGKQIFQSDIAQYTGMAKEQIEFRKNNNNQEPYWTNSAFGGMPTYQLGAKYPHNYIKSLDSVLRFLPRPADYLFLYFLGFYVLMLGFRVSHLKAFFGALAFGFSTYLIVILGAGHNAKAHAIAYIPFLLAGIVYIFNKRYVLGTIITLLGAALELQANHFQMTYYFAYLLLFVGIVYVIHYTKQKDFKHIYTSIGLLSLSAILAVGLNATSILATMEYTNFSTRSNSELTLDPDGKKKDNKNAMSYEYITQYSYGIAESLNLISPHVYGGSHREDLGQESAMYQFILGQNVPEEEARNLVKNMPAYWGEQPLVEAPAYIGVLVFYLAILGLFLERRPIKWALLTGVIFSLMLSWGKNFHPLTDFFIQYVPLYNKFRAVSSIQVVLELCMPILAVLGLHAVFTNEDKPLVKKYVMYTTIVVGSILLVLLMANSAFTFTGEADKEIMKNYPADFYNVLKEDRQNMFVSSLLRSLGFIAACFVVFFLFIRNTLSKNLAIVIVGVLMVADLFFIDKKYVNSDRFVSKSKVEKPFDETEADLRILEDTTNYRVFEIAGNMNSARSSFFHKSIGGYSAVKPKKFQELFDYHIANNNIEVLNMLNTKYVIRTEQDNENNQKDMALLNTSANGNAWFVSKITIAKTADEELKLLGKIKTKEEAIYREEPLTKGNFGFKTGKDSTAFIKLTSYKSNLLKYVSYNSKDGFGVFSEIYYPYGWKATIDGKDAKIYNVNYVLRGLQIPAGKHTIEFKFEPQVVKIGSTIALVSSVLVLGIFGMALFYFQKKKKKLADL